MIRDFVTGIIKAEDLQRDFDSIKKPEVRFKIRQDLLKLVIPDPVNPDKLTEHQMEEIINYLESKHK